MHGNPGECCQSQSPVFADSDFHSTFLPTQGESLILFVTNHFINSTPLVKASLLVPHFDPCAHKQPATQPSFHLLFMANYIA